MLCSNFFLEPAAMMRPDAKVEKVYLYPKPVDFRKSIDGLAALMELDIKVAVFDPVLFVFLNKSRNRVKILYWERNGFCLWLTLLCSRCGASGKVATRRWDTGWSSRPGPWSCLTRKTVRESTPSLILSFAHRRAETD